MLLVEDEASIAEPFARALGREGFDAEVAGTAAAARAAFARKPPSIVLLDLALPDGDGRELCREWRRDADVPIIMLTARGTETDRVVGLELGADDYVVKPFSPAELVARVDAVLRRADLAPDRGERLTLGSMTIDPGARRVWRGDEGEEVELTAREFDLLLFLARHPGQVFSREQLMEAVWHHSFYTDTSTVTVHIRRLRAKIEADPTRPRHVDTVWGVGYRFSP